MALFYFMLSRFGGTLVFWCSYYGLSEVSINPVLINSNSCIQAGHGSNEDWVKLFNGFDGTVCWHNTACILCSAMIIHGICTASDSILWFVQGHAQGPSR